ncbi:MAG TPA: PilZ domain-containing protein [Kofleriaceae bacterium]|nr:PilZ domain-containing protein [Kofleriaceae bacterium]
MSTERREHPRVGFDGKASIARGPAERFEFALRDLSTTGARVVGATRLVEGERVHVRLEIEGTTIEVFADVVRTEPQNSQAALEFVEVPAETAAAIESALTGFIERVRASSPPTVIVVGASDELNAALERDLAQLGRATRPCATQLELTWALEDRTTVYEAAVLASDMDPIQIGSVLEHLAEQHSNIRRLVLFGDQLSSLEKAASSRVQAVLRTPLRIRALARALGVNLTDSSQAMVALVHPDDK